MDRNFVNFRAIYDELTDEVSRSAHAFLQEHLSNWLSSLDETPGVSAIVVRLGEGLDFERWYADAKETMGSMVGSGTLTWPREREKRLGMKLMLFRQFASGKIDPMDFCSKFLWVANDYEMNTRALVDQLFGPMARELRRYLEVEFSKAETVPASDRVVHLDHNSAAYSEAAEALDKLEHTLVSANDYEDIEDKEQRIAEVSAARRLLKSARVRVGAIVGVIGPTLAYLGTKFMDKAIGNMADVALQALKRLFGAIF